MTRRGARKRKIENSGASEREKQRERIAGCGALKLARFIVAKRYSIRSGPVWFVCSLVRSSWSNVRVYTICEACGR